MSRKPSVRYYDSRKGYYTQIDGKQHRLADGPDDSPTGPTYLKAIEAYKQLLTLGAISTSKDANTVRAVMETYIARNKDRLSEKTFSRRMYSLTPFCDALGDVRICDLTHTMIEDFLAKMRQPRKIGKQTYKWGQGAVATFFLAVNAGFNFAVKRRLITINPLDGLTAPTVRSKSRDCVISPEQHQGILKASKAESFRRVIIALENTGARPGEICAATAQAWNDEDGCLIYYADTTRQEGEHRHKTANQKDRIIFFTGDALTMMRQLVSEHPVGSLFRTKDGTAYSAKVICSCFRALRKRSGLPKLTAYSYRHTRATRWILAGRNIDVLAELLGNTPAVIRKHYAHLMADRRAIRRQLEDFLVLL